MDFDYSALEGHISQRDIDAYRAQRLVNTGFDAWLVARKVLYALIVLLGIMTSIDLVATFFREGIEESVAKFFGYLFVGGIIGALYVVTRRFIFSGMKRELRYSQFAAANRLTYTPERSGVQYPGVLFVTNPTGRLLHSLQGTYNDTSFEVAAYEYPKGKSIHAFGFVRLELDRFVPHILLDAKKPSKQSLWPVGFDFDGMFKTAQKQHLEGNFDEYFELYVPKGYEQDVRYVFTPDLMALFIDHIKVYDVEIIDNQLFIYIPEGLPFDEAASMQRLFEMIATIDAKVNRRTARYRDDMSPVNDQVAVKGQRLVQKRVLGISSAIVILVICWLYFSQ